METLHSINSKDIENSIGSPNQAVSLVRDLIWAEGGRQRIDITKISVSSKIYAKDGGVDGIVDVKPQNESGLLTKGLTYLQIKWGDTFDPRKKQKIESELTTKKKLKPKIESLAKKGGKYVLFWFGGVFKGTEKDKCLENIQEIFRKNNFPNMKISVLDQDDIANLCNLHPPVISKYFIPLTDFFSTIDTWKDRFWKDEIYGKDVEAIIKRNLSTFNTLIRSCNNSPYTPVQLISNDDDQYLINRILIYKIFSNEVFASRTICIDAENLRSPLSTTLESRHDLNQLVIIDNCKKEHHQAIIDLLGQRSRRLNLIVLSRDYEVIKNQSFAIIGWNGSEHSVFLKEIQKSAYSDNVGQRLSYEQKVPTLKKIIPSNYVKAAYDEIAKQYGFEILTKSKRILRYIALFSSIGSENNRTRELEYLAQNAGFDKKHWLDFIEIIHILRDSGLVTGKYFLKISNKDLRRFLIQEWWEIYGPAFDFYNFLTNTYAFSERLAGRLIDSLSYITSSEKGQEVAKILLGPYGPFASGELLKDNFGARLFNKLSEADPQTALSCLSDTMGKWTVDELQKYDNRRDIVFALEKISWWDELFDGAATLLLKLAEAENEEGIANNATGVFTELFSPGYGRLSPTERSPRKRFEIIEKIFDSKIENRILIALKACNTALQTRHFTRMIAGDGPWAGRVFRPWMPKTYGELFDYYKDVWTFLEKQIDNVPKNLKNNITKILTNNARGLVTIKYLSYMVLKTIDNLSQMPKIEKGPIIDAIYTILKFEKENIDSKIIKTLKDADEKITGSSFHTKLQRYVGMYNMLRDLGTESSPEIKELAKEGIKDKKVIKKELPILVKSGLKKSYQFGYEIGAFDENFSLLNDIIQEQKKVKKKDLDLNFLAGYCKAIFEKKPSELETLLNNLSKSSKTVKWIPSLIYGSRINLTDNDLKRLIKLTKDKKIDVSEFYRFYIGGTTRVISEKVFLEFCKLLKNKQGSFFHLLEFYYQYFIIPKKVLPKKFTYGILCNKFINNTTTDLQFNPSTFSYVEIAKQFVLQNPDLGLKLIKKYLDEGNDTGSFLTKFDNEFDEIISELTKIKPSEIWKLVSQYIQIPIDMVTYRIQNWLRGTSFFTKTTGGLEYMDMDEVFGWIEKDVDNRSWFIASIVPPNLESQSGKPSWVRKLLIKYGELKSVRNELIANFSTEGFSGSEVEHYKNKKEKLLKFQKQEKNSKVNQWIEEYISIINSDIERGQKFEESFNF